MVYQTNHKILIVDDDPGTVRLLSNAIDSEGYRTDSAPDGEKALEMAAKKDDYSLIISDIGLPRMSGFEFLRALVKVKPDTPIIIISGHAEFGFVQEALQLGAVAFLVKPFGNEELLKWVNKVMAHEKESLDHNRFFDRLISEKQEMVVDTATLIKDNYLSRLVGHLSSRLLAGVAPNRVGGLKVVIAIHEALRNSLEHGNLNLSSTLKPDMLMVDNVNQYEKLMQERLEDFNYAEKKIFLKFTRTAKKAELVIRDEGNGFDHRSLLESQRDGMMLHGRGLVLIGAGVDEVSYNDSGNEITLTRYAAK